MRGTLRSISILIPLTALLVIVFASPPWAGSPGYLYIPGIHGSAVDPAHRNWIEVLSFDWGSVPPPRGSMITAPGKGPAGKLFFGDFSFLKQVDETSSSLADCCLRNILLPFIRVKLPEKAAGRFSYLVLRKVKVLSVQPGKTKREESQTELVTVSFRQVEYQ